MTSRKVTVDPFFVEKAVIYTLFFFVCVGQLTAAVETARHRHYLESAAWLVSFLSLTLARALLRWKLPLSLSLHREKAGVIAKEKMWVAFIDSHMYTETSLYRLAKQIITQWQDERNIVG